MVQPSLGALIEVPFKVFEKFRKDRLAHDRLLQCDVDPEKRSGLDLNNRPIRYPLIRVHRQGLLQPVHHPRVVRDPDGCIERTFVRFSPRLSEHGFVLAQQAFRLGPVLGLALDDQVLAAAGADAVRGTRRQLKSWTHAPIDVKCAVAKRPLRKASLSRGASCSTVSAIGPFIASVSITFRISRPRWTPPVWS